MVSVRDVDIARTAGYTRTTYNGKPLPSNWPEPLDEAAFYGAAGEAVRAMAPHTEADPAALMVQFLTGVGNMFPAARTGRLVPTNTTQTCLR